MRPSPEREWRLLAADGNECWEARVASGTAVGADADDSLHEVVICGNETYNTFTVTLPAVPIQRARLLELHGGLADWLALPLAQWAAQPFQTTAELSDGSSGTLALSWAPSAGWILAAGATVATCRFRSASLAVHHEMVVDPTCLGLFHAELGTSLHR